MDRFPYAAGQWLIQPKRACGVVCPAARLEELRREREAAQAPASDLSQDPPMRSTRNGYGSQREIGSAHRTSPTGSHPRPNVRAY
jgi:hypothetical protein